MWMVAFCPRACLCAGLKYVLLLLLWTFLRSCLPHQRQQRQPSRSAFGNPDLCPYVSDRPVGNSYFLEPEICKFELRSGLSLPQAGQFGLQLLHALSRLPVSLLSRIRTLGFGVRTPGFCIRTLRLCLD